MFDFLLAEKLGMTVGDMRHRMSSQEHLHWRMLWEMRRQQQELDAKKPKGR